MRFILLMIVILCLCNNLFSEIIYVDSDKGNFLRSEPNLKSDIIAKLSNQYYFKVLQYSSNKDRIDNTTTNWVEVNYNETNGWIFGGYVNNNIFLSVMDRYEITKDKKYKYYFTLQSQLFTNLNSSQFETQTNDIVPFDKNLYYSDISKTKNDELYLLSDDKQIKIKDFQFAMVNNFIYYSPYVIFTIKDKINPKTSILLNYDSFREYKKRHHKKLSKTYKLTKHIKIKNYSYKKIIEQYSIDLNGDNKNETISLIEAPIQYCLSDISLIITFNDGKNIELFLNDDIDIKGFINIPLHDYPVLKVYFVATGTGYNGEFIILFKKNSRIPVFIPVNFTHDT